MKLTNAFLAATAITHCVSAAAVPNSDVALNIRWEDEHSNTERSTLEELWKRKGGGGGAGKGGGSSGSSSGSSSGGSSSGKGGSSSSSGSSGSSGSAGKGSSSSSSGGSTRTGSGPSPAYGGGAYYGGGSRSPYASGSRSPSGIVPGLLIGSSLGVLGAYWALGAYHYGPYGNPYYYHNGTTNKNETKPVDCLCAMYQECGCDDNGNQTYFNSVIGDGTYAGLNKTLVNVANVNGTDTIFLNGTLPNGTTASGGTEDAYSAAADGLQNLLQAAGWWPLAATAFALALA